MKYLNNNQVRALNAVEQYAPRRLTPVEQVVKQLIQVNAVPYNNNKDVYQDYIREILRNLEAATTNYRLLERIKAAANDPLLLPEVVQLFPYVEFEEQIRNPALTGLMYAAKRGVGFSDLQSAARWLESLHVLLTKLPLDVNTFLATPETNYGAMRCAVVNQKRPECLGMILPTSLQANINSLFGGGAFRQRALVEEYQLHKVENLGSIFGVKQGSQIPGISTHLVFDKEHIDRSRHHVLTVTQQHDEAVRAVYRFVI